MKVNVGSWLARGERGQAILELTFALPILLLLFLLLVDTGLAIDRRIVLQHAVRDGARLGSVAAEPADVAARTEEQAQGLIELDDVTVCYIDGPDGNTTVGDPTDIVHVEVDYSYSFNTVSGGLLNSVGVSPPTVNISPHAEFLLEGSVAGATECS
jgi:hypothetical protein